VPVIRAGCSVRVAATLEEASPARTRDTDGTMTTPKPPRPNRARRTYPVEVTQLPVVRCAVCGRTFAHRPGQASAVLTDHYASAHRDPPSA